MLLLGPDAGPDRGPDMGGSGLLLLLANPPVVAYSVLNLTPAVVESDLPFYIRCQIQGVSAGNLVDPSGGSAYMALVDTINLPYDPVSGDYIGATWETYQDNTLYGDTFYFINLLAGSGQSAILAGHEYEVWVKIVGAGNTFETIAGLISCRA